MELFAYDLKSSRIQQTLSRRIPAIFRFLKTSNLADAISNGLDNIQSPIP